MFIKNGKNYKTYYTGLSEEQIKKGNAVTLILSALIFISSVALAFIPQPAKVVANEEFTWFLSVNLLLIVLPLAISLYCLIRHFLGYRLREEITTDQLPKGLIGDKKTFSGIEIQMIIGGLTFICQVALCVYEKELITILCTLISLVYFAAAIGVRVITYKAFCSLSEVKPKEQEANEEIEEFYNG